MELNKKQVAERLGISYVTHLNRLMREDRPPEFRLTPVRYGRMYGKNPQPFFDSNEVDSLKSRLEEKRNPKEKTCSKCGLTQAAKLFKKKTSICHSCKKARDSKYAKANRAKRNAIKRRYCARNKEKLAQRSQQYMSKYKATVHQAYGSKCACCGETEPKFLTIDHIKNDGAKHRKELSQNKRSGRGGAIYRWLIKNEFPKDNFQLLCWNCNLGKHLNKGTCPHKRKAPRGELRRAS